VVIAGMDWVLERFGFGKTRDMCVVSWLGAFLGPFSFDRLCIPEAGMLCRERELKE
jgi:hypothetical protein